MRPSYDVDKKSNQFPIIGASAHMLRKNPCKDENLSVVTFYKGYSVLNLQNRCIRPILCISKNSKEAGRKTVAESDADLCSHLIVSTKITLDRRSSNEIKVVFIEDHCSSLQTFPIGNVCNEQQLS